MRNGSYQCETRSWWWIINHHTPHSMSTAPPRGDWVSAILSTIRNVTDPNRAAVWVIDFLWGNYDIFPRDAVFLHFNVILPSTHMSSTITITVVQAWFILTQVSIAQYDNRIQYYIFCSLLTVTVTSILMFSCKAYKILFKLHFIYLFRVHNHTAVQLKESAYSRQSYGAVTVYHLEYDHNSDLRASSVAWG